MSPTNNDTDNTNIFNTDNVLKVLIKFSIPTIFALLVSEMYNMVDSLYIGKTIGGDGIAALTIAFPIQNLFLSVAFLVATGALTYVARSLGENNIERIKKIVPTAISFVLSVSAALVAIIYLFLDPILKFLGASQNTLAYSKTYISVILIGSLFYGVSLVLAYTLTALGDSKVTLKITSIGALANIIINYILIIIFDMGIAGAAISTTVSQILSTTYAYYKFKQGTKDLNIRLIPSKISFNIGKSIFFIGFSTFIIEISDAVVAVILNNLLIANGGDAAIATVGLITRVSMFLFITVIGISSAMQPLAAYSHGQKDYKRLAKVLKTSIVLISITTTVLWAAMMIFAKQIMFLFVDDMAMLETIVPAFRIVVSVFPLICLYYVSIYYYQAIGNARTSFVLSIYRQLIVFIPLVYLLVEVFNLGTLGAWLAFPISDFISFLTSLIYAKRSSSELLELTRIQDKPKRSRNNVVKPAI